MILYDPDLTVEMFRYGVQIPVKDSRARKTFEHLSAHPQLAASKKRWHSTKITENLAAEDLKRVHAADYVARLFSDELENELIRTYELVDAQGNYHRYDPTGASLPLTDMRDWIFTKAAGTYQAARCALDSYFCFYFAGGMHHAQYDRGSGFCLINDIVIAIRRLQAEARIKKAWVIDLDAHKGDGTAALTAGDDSIRTLSIHMASGWPLDQPEFDGQGRPNPSFTPSDIDIPIGDHENDHYNDRLKQGLERLRTLSTPELAVVVCGSDPYELDELPSTSGLALTLEQLLERDQQVYSFLTAAGVPAAFLMAGGYGENSWRVYAQFLEWVLLDRLQ
jgi:acetoin utilization deacetylase AcuC-like enzyme